MKVLSLIMDDTTADYPTATDCKKQFIRYAVGHRS